MNGVATTDDENGTLVRVSLACISCGTVEEIHVFQERRPPGAMYWECFDCQERRSRSGGWPEATANL